MCYIGTLNILDTQSWLFYKPNVVFKSCGPLLVHNIDSQTPYEALLFPKPGLRSNEYLARLGLQCGDSVSHQPGIFLMSKEFAS